MSTMEFPTIWLTAAILIHGIFGSYVDLLMSLTVRVSGPLSGFYNESLRVHYGHAMTAADAVQISACIRYIVTAGVVFSTLFLLPRIDNFGRKTMAVYSSGVLGALAAVMVILSKYLLSIELFAFAQFLIGALMPFKLAVAKLYMAECAPDSIRGFSAIAVAVFAACTWMGISLLSLEQVFGTEDKWVFLAVAALVMSLVFLALASCIPESPKYMSFKNVDKEHVVRTIEKFHGINADTEKILANYSSEFQLTNATRTNLKQLWTDLAFRDSLFLILVSGVFGSLSAVQILDLNNLQLKMRYGFADSTALIIDTVIGTLSMPFLFSLPYLLERAGRRTLFFASMGMALSTLATMCLTQVVFAVIGPGAITRTLTFVFSLLNFSEISESMSIILIADLLPVSAKVNATQCLLLFLSLSSMGTTLFYSKLEPLLGALVLVPFIAIQSSCLYYFYHNLPETSGRTISENYEQMKNKADSHRYSLLHGQPNQTNTNYGT